MTSLQIVTKQSLSKGLWKKALTPCLKIAFVYGNDSKAQIGDEFSTLKPAFQIPCENFQLLFRD